MSTEGAAAVEERLAALEAASDQRRAELKAVLDDLPHAVSRRAVVTSVARDLRAAPHKSQIARRVVAKLGRIPGAAIRRIRAR